MDDPETIAYRNEVATLVQSTQHLDAPLLLKKAAHSWDKHQDLKADFQRHDKIQKIKNPEEHIKVGQKILNDIRVQEAKLKEEVNEMNSMFFSIPLREFTDFEPEYLKLGIANDPFPHYKMTKNARDELVMEEDKILRSPCITREQMSKFREKVFETKLIIKRCICRIAYIIENSEEIEKAKQAKILEREKEMQEDEGEEEGDEEEQEKMQVAQEPTEDDKEDDDYFDYDIPF